MYKYKKTIVLIMALILSLLATGCNKEDASKTVDPDEVIEISYGHGFMPETPHHKAAVKFKEEVEEATNGRVKVTLFPLWTIRKCKRNV